MELGRSSTIRGVHRREILPTADFWCVFASEAPKSNFSTEIRALWCKIEKVPTCQGFLIQVFARIDTVSGHKMTTTRSFREKPIF